MRFPRRCLPPGAALVPFLGALVLSGCGPSGGDVSKKGGGFPPAAVSVVSVQAADLPVELEYTGQTVGFREVEIRPRVGGILLSRNFQEGSRVARGQSLFNIDPAPFEAAAARAEADLAGAEARLEQTRRNVGRLKPLRDAGMVTLSAFEDALSAQSVASAESKSARTRLDEAKLNLGYTRVLAPVSGIASRAQHSEGSLVSGPETLLASVTQVDPMYVVFGIPDNEQQTLRRESESGRLVLPKQGRFEVEVKLADGSSYARRGKLGFSDVRVNAATGTSEARAELPNPDGALRPGQFVRVRLTGAVRPKAIKVPQRAVLEGPQGKFVYLVNDKGQAEVRPVQAGEWAGSDWIISDGLKPGERVIVDGVMRIGPGAPVQVADAAAKPPAGGAAPEAAKDAPGKGADSPAKDAAGAAAKK
jgi:membrane fusion protein (multidrug efflux system)